MRIDVNRENNMHRKNKIITPVYIVLTVIIAVVLAGTAALLTGPSPVSAAEEKTGNKWQKMIATDLGSFQTGKTKMKKGSVYVVSFNPVGQTRSVDETDEVNITFSEPVAPLEKAVKDAPPLISITPAIKGEGYWKSSTTYGFRLDEKLKLSSKYKVNFKGYKAFSGKMIEPREWAFSTPTISIRRLKPYNRARWQTLNQNVLVQFTQDVDPNRIAKFINIITSNGMHAFNVRYANEKERRLLYYYRRDQKDVKKFVVINPQTPYPVASDVTARFLPGLPSMEGNIGLQKERELKFRTYEIFRVVKVSSKFRPDLGVDVQLSNPVNLKHFYETIRFEPAMESQKGGNWTSSRISIGGKYTPGATYTLIIPAGLKDQFGNQLPEERRFTVKCLDYSPYLYPPARSHFVFEDYLEKRLPVNVRNRYYTDVFYKKLEPSDILSLYYPNWQTLQMKRMDRKTCNTYKWNLKVEKNRNYTMGLDFQTIDIGDPGFYYLYFSNHSRGSHYHGSLMQLTDIALVAKYSPTQVFILPFNLKTGEVVPYLDFTIRGVPKNDKNKNSANLLFGEFKGRQNGIGIYQPGLDVLENHNLFDSFVFSNPSQGFIWGRKYDMFDMWQFSTEGGVDYNYSSRYVYNHLFAFTDKYLYKGGQTVKFKGILRQTMGGRFSIPQVDNFDVEVFNSRGKSLKKFVIPGSVINTYGSFAGDFKLPAETPTGFYRIVFKGKVGKNLLNKTVRFSVQEYKPAKFEVKVKFHKKRMISGQPFSGIVNGRYLFGTPMKEATGKCTWTMKQAFFTPPGWDKYTFGTSDSFHRQVIYKKDFVLDPEGNFKFEKDKVTAPGKNSVTLSVYGDVKDKDNNRISSSKSIMVHRGEYYIGVKTGSYFFKEKKPGKLQVVTVSPEGKTFKNTEVQLKIVREEWKSFQKKDASGALRWDWKKITEDVLQEDLQLPDGTFEKEYTFDKTGYYKIYLTGKDSLDNTVTTTGYFYVTGSGYVSWGVNEGRTIDLVTDKKEYKPGETVEVLVKSPFESATVLVTAERERVMWSKVIKMTGNANTVQVPVKKSFMPNFYINVLILKERTGLKWDEQGNDTGKPRFFAGYTAVKVDSTEKKLTVNVKPHKKSYEPGEEVKLDIHVTDKTGAPVSSEVCLSIVDKGVLNLVGYQLPDPYDFFWKKRLLDVKTISTLGDVLGRKKFKEKGENPGGGGGLSPYGSVVVRKNFKESAYYTAFVETDANGKATVTFKLPDNLTTFKAMAVAGTKADRFGRGSQDILVKKNIILKPAVTDFTRPGDKMTAGVTVTNNSGQKLKIKVEVQTKNLRLADGEDREKKIKLTPGETKAVWYRFRADGVGMRQMTFKAVGGGFSDGLLAEIPTRVPQFVEAAATFNKVEKDPVFEQIVVPSGTIRELDNAEVSLASSAMVGVKRNFDLLQEYPYECLEQRISKQYPLVAAGDFLIEYGLLDIDTIEIRKRINGLLGLMPKYQAAGAFKYYPDSCCVSPYLTCYAVEFILDAKKKGYSYDQHLLKRAQSYLKKVAMWSIDSRYPYSKNVRWQVQAYAVYVLAKDNVFMKDAVNNLFEVRDRLPFAGIAYLVKTLDLEHNLPPYMQRVLAKTMVNKMKDEPTMTHFENNEDDSWCWVHETNVKTTATVLETFLEVYGKFPYAEKIARWLTRPTLQKRRLSTQDNIRLFMAFEKYYKVYESATPDFVADVLFNDKSKIKETFKGREMKMKIHRVPLDQFTPGDGVRLSFQKKGTGILYYLLRMKYYPAGEVDALNRGFYVTKTYKTLDGGVVEGNTFKAGEKYIVEVNVETKMERPFVMLDDPLPSGMKVLNPDFKTTSALDTPKATRDRRYRGYWGYFYRSEIYYDRVQVFADFLKRGKHTWTYLVIATNPGVYTVPNTVASEMYNPEVFGRNQNRSITIK